MTTRATRAERTEQNRRTVLDAARRTFVAAGYHGATLDAIALEAGFSKGVIYSQFDSKDDLFLALLAERIEERRQASARQADRRSGVDAIVTVARDAIGETADTLAWQTLLLEFRVHAARHPRTQARYLELHERTIEGTAQILTGVFERAGIRLPMPSHMLAVSWLAVGSGLAAELLVDPELDVRAIAARFAEGLAALASQALENHR